jgi:putative glutamine amidotransferase
MSRQPIIGVSACTKQIGHNIYHTAGDKYLQAIVHVAGGMPLIVPALGDQIDQTYLLQQLDGLVFTGSPSNVEPHHYSGPASEPGTAHDVARDSTTLPLIKAAIAAGVPVLGICRGFQEMNVAFGGTLHQRLHDVDGFIEHRENKDQPVDQQYGLSHEVHIEPGGLLYELSGCGSAQVNSLHTQGVDQLAPGLRPEATAPDGLVEAFSVSQASSFALGVQWHPEWKVKENTFYLSIFKAFGDACRARSNRHS